MVWYKTTYISLLSLTLEYLCLLCCQTDAFYYTSKWIQNCWAFVSSIFWNNLCNVATSRTNNTSKTLVQLVDQKNSCSFTGALTLALNFTILNSKVLCFQASFFKEIRTFGPLRYCVCSFQGNNLQINLFSCDDWI